MDEHRTNTAELLPGQAVNQVFVVRDKQLRTTKTGEYFLTLNLGDKTGTIDGRMWKANEAIFQSIPAEGFLRIRGRVEEYRGKKQLIVEALKPLPFDAVDPADFTPCSPFDLENMFTELQELLRAVKNKHLKALLKKFYEDKAIMSRFKVSPAAVQMHQPYVGGLLEHTLNVTKAASLLLPMYPQLNDDLVLIGAFLHDIAKSAELTGGLSNRYTDRGQLVGHLVIGSIWIQEKAKLVEEETGEPFPHHLINLLQHVVLSHHGEYEYGSPKLPAVPEAFFLHYLDNLDAKMWMTAHAIDADVDEDSAFTAYLPQLQTRIYKKHNLMDEKGEKSLFED